MRYRHLLPAAVAALVINGCGDVSPPDVPFLGHGDSYESKPDLARVEHELPLGPGDLMKLTPQNLEQLPWMPPTCAYRLLYEKKPLPDWHPLVSGRPASVHDAGASVRGRCISEEFVHEDDLLARIVDWEE